MRRLSLHFGSRRTRFMLLSALLAFGGAAALALMALHPRAQLLFKPSLSRALHYQEDLQAYAAQYGSCPEFHELFASRFVFQEVIFTDPWHEPFRPSCPPSGPMSIISAGADRRFGTADDLNSREPDAWPYEWPRGSSQPISAR